MIYTYKDKDSYEQMGETDYENPWTYQGATFTSDDIGDFFGFVYRITNTQNGRQYIGRKYFVQKRKPRGGKRRVTGRSTMEVLQNLSPMLNDWGKRTLEEK